MRLPFVRALVSLAGLAAMSATSCYSTGDGANPPVDLFYFPVGLQVSHGGSVLYAVNSDFDLQFNGGTIQSYDLTAIRRDVLRIIKDPSDTNVPLARAPDPNATCAEPPIFKEGGGRQPLGETCAPPVKSSPYLRDWAIIGAFPTDLRLSPPPEHLVPQFPRLEREGHPCTSGADCGGGLRCDVGVTDACVTPAGNRNVDRLFAPVRGNATLTWATVVRDRFEDVPLEGATSASYAPFQIGCGQNNVADRRCDAAHMAGEDPREAGNTRGLTMPGEPFGMTMSEDGESIVITHQNEPKTSLFTTGLSRNDVAGVEPPVPAIQFVLEQVPIGGIGVAPVPHDRNAFAVGQILPRPAFYETSRSVAQVSLLRMYPDQVAGTNLGAGFDQTSSLRRPFLELESGFPITVAAGGADSRGVVVDPSPRIRCKLAVLPASGARTQAQVDDDLRACARTPARVFIANRTPPALLVGDVGVTEGVDGTYDPDRLVLHTSVPLSNGPSEVYLAPVVERDGGYGLRVFVLCFDAATLYVYDPNAGVIENVIRVAPGPAALAFDPFTVEAVARHEQVPVDSRVASGELRRYRFAYLASFTQSFVQIIDLDNAQPVPATFEKIVFTLGVPTNPKGT